jgi:hypothetical protein
LFKTESLFRNWIFYPDLIDDLTREGYDFTASDIYNRWFYSASGIDSESPLFKSSQAFLDELSLLGEDYFSKLYNVLPHDYYYSFCRLPLYDGWQNDPNFSIFKRETPDVPKPVLRAFARLLCEQSHYFLNYFFTDRITPKPSETYLEWLSFAGNIVGIAYIVLDNIHNSWYELLWDEIQTYFEFTNDLYFPFIAGSVKLIAFYLVHKSFKSDFKCDNIATAYIMIQVNMLLEYEEVSYFYQHGPELEFDSENLVYFENDQQIAYYDHVKKLAKSERLGFDIGTLEPLTRKVFSSVEIYRALKTHLDPYLNDLKEYDRYAIDIFTGIKRTEPFN